MSGSPPPRSPKRLKLEGLSSPYEGPEKPAAYDSTPLDMTPDESADEDGQSDDGEHCIICLQLIVDRTVLPSCAHDSFCFECVTIWTSQSRKCPLCTSAIGPYLIHNVRSKYDFQKHYLPPLRTSPTPQPLVQIRGNAQRSRRRRVPEVQWGRPSTIDRTEQDELERAIEKRKWVYRHDLYAKHVASNAYTRYKPHPTPAQFAASQDLISRTTAFIRRELQVWVNLDVEFLTTFIISLMKSIDIRSEAAVKLIAEFLDMSTPYTVMGRKTNAEHFAHEVYCYLRSPHRDLAVYDSIVQYDTPVDAPAPPLPRERQDRWMSRQSRSPFRGRHEVNDDPLEYSPRDAVSPRSSELFSESNSRQLSRYRDRRTRSHANNPESSDRARDVLPHSRHEHSRSPSSSRVRGASQKGKERAKDREESPTRRKAASRTRPLSRSPSRIPVHCLTTHRSPLQERNPPDGMEVSMEVDGNNLLVIEPVETQLRDMPSPTSQLLSTSTSSPSPIRQHAVPPQPLDKGISIKGASLDLRGPHLGISIKGAASMKKPGYTKKSTPLTHSRGTEAGMDVNSPNTSSSNPSNSPIELPGLNETEGMTSTVLSGFQESGDHSLNHAHSEVANTLAHTGKTRRRRRSLLPADRAISPASNTLEREELKRGYKDLHGTRTISSNQSVMGGHEVQQQTHSIGTNTTASKPVESRGPGARALDEANDNTMEAALRAKARLRMRLAAERRLNEENATRSEHRPIGRYEREQDEALHSPHDELKEAILKDQLRRRKVTNS